MQIMRLTGLRKMEMFTVPRPEIRHPADVLVRMTHVGVCGSDIHYYLHGRVGGQVVQYPFAAGHEGGGVVAAVGPAVRRVRVGDTVAIDPAMPCGECDQCRCGRENTCRQLRFLGCPGQAEGCLGEYLVMPESSCFPLPAGLGAEDGALSEPLSIGVYAVRQSVPMAGARVAILGSGPIGLSVLTAARAAGAAVVHMTDKIADRLAQAKKHGADSVWQAEGEDPVAGILAREPLQLDAVFECCGQQAAVDQALRLLKPGGRLVLVGIPETERLSFSMDECRRRELSLQNIRRQNHCVQATLDGMASGALPVRWMITHRFPLARAVEAYDMVAGYRDGVLKAMICL